MAEKTVTIQQLERKKQAMEDEIYQWKQRRYQLEEIESDLARLQLVEQELIMLSSEMQVEKEQQTLRKEVYQ